MNHRERSIPLTVFTVLVALSAPALAQVDNDISVTATPGASSITVTVDMDVGGTLPAAWVGFVVDRTTIGFCEDTHQVGDVTPFPSGAQVFPFDDHDVAEDRTYRYRVFAVDAAGQRSYLGAPPDWPPGYYHDDFAALGGAGYVGAGTLVSGGMGAAQLVTCDDDCWMPVSFVSVIPPTLEPAVDSGVVVLLEGTLDNEFEGPYISTITDFWIKGECGTVPNAETSWGGLKATYR